MCLITVETLVVCDATSHIEWHRHLADADTERGSKFAIYISLYPTNPAPIPPHIHIWQSFKEESDGPLGGTASLEDYIYMQIISVYICK